MAFMTAGDVKLADPLKPVLSGYNKNAQGNLSTALGTLNSQAKAGSLASGRVQGTYQPTAIGRAGTMASQGITNNLGSVLGGVSLKDLQNQQEFDRQMALANEIGAMEKPSMASEILGGLSQGVNLGAQGKGLYDALGRNGGGSSSPTYGISSPSNYGYGYPQTPDFGYGQQYPSMLRR